MKVKLKKKIYDVSWQEYPDTGFLYVAIYQNGKLFDQFTVLMEEKEEFIKQLKEKEVKE